MESKENLTFEEELTDLIRRRSLVNRFADTPDFILANYIMRSLDNYMVTVSERDRLQLSTHQNRRTET